MGTNDGQSSPPEHDAPGTFEARPVRSFKVTSWREGVLTRAEELEALLNWVKTKAEDSQQQDLQAENRQKEDQVLIDAVSRHLNAAISAAEKKGRLRWLFDERPIFERARSNLDAAEAILLQLAPSEYIEGLMPSLLTNVERHLASDDPRRQECERIAQKLDEVKPNYSLSEQERGKIVSAVRGADAEALRDQMSVGTFRNIVVVATLVMTLLAAGIAIMGALSPTIIPMCFLPEKSGQTLVVCPAKQSMLDASTLRSGSVAPDVNDTIKKTVRRVDLFVVEFIGLAAASVAGVNRIRSLRGSSDPWGLSVALAVLKLPTGALTAFLGILLLGGQFVPGLGALDTPGQILAWAAVFGYAQQLFTRYVDQQAYNILAPEPDTDKRQ
jgi:hypothetical protein